MDSERATKRRKLDRPDRNAQKSTPTSQRKQKPATYASKKPGFQIRATPAPEKPVRPSAHESWAQATAKGFGLHPSKKIKVKKTEAELYDDIDGAHPSPPKKVVSTGKRKAQLDPLRNQRVESASSPIRKTASKAAVGLFKQFRAPRPEVAPSTPKVNGWVGEDGRHDTPAIESSAGLGAEEEDEEQASGREEDGANGARSIERLDGDAQTEIPSLNGQPAGRKKTFVDEVRELEEAARREAKQEEQGDTPEASSAKRRSSGRPRKDVVTGKARAAPAGLVESAEKARRIDHGPERRKANGAEFAEDHTEDVVGDDAQDGRLQAARRRKANRADHIDAHVEAGPPSTDAMETDDPEDERQALAGASPETLPPTKQLATPSKSKPKPHQTSKSKPTPGHFVFSTEQLAALQSVVLAQLTGKRPIPLTNLTGEYTKVSTLITQTVIAGESNSMLLIGARGSGKTALVNHILREQAAAHPEDFHVVRLNGFIHTDDKIALREIWRQLGRELSDDDDEGQSKNYADTLTTLLALLSHPAEQGREVQAPEHVTKSVVFILDEFELFATHPRQTLLYNLFDIAQSRKAPVAVLGLTSRIDVSEGLEKRVKSRFGHRYVYLGVAKNFGAYKEECKSALCVGEETMGEEEGRRLGEAGEEWDKVVGELLETEACEKHLRRLYYTTKSIPGFMASMLLPIATVLCDSDSDIDSRALLTHLTAGLPGSTSLAPPDSKLSLLPSLSTLQHALLICAARLTNIYNTDIVSFALAYEEYKTLASKAKLQGSATGAGGRMSRREVARGAWEGLVGSGLVVGDGRGGGSAGSGRVDIGLEEIGASGVELGGWGRWCREI